MSEPINAAGGWCAPSATIYNLSWGQPAYGHEFDEEVAAWPRVRKGGAVYTFGEEIEASPPPTRNRGLTFNISFTNKISPEVYRILTGWEPPELETLL
jgi:hypothetical protein